MACASHSASASRAGCRRRHARRLDDVDHADVLNPILREKGVKSLLGVPLSLAAKFWASSTSAR